MSAQPRNLQFGTGSLLRALPQEGSGCLAAGPYNRLGSIW